MRFQYHHFGIPTQEVRSGESYNSRLECHGEGYYESVFGIEWLRFDPDCPLPDLVKTVPHVAFRVDDLHAAIQGLPVVVPPAEPTPGVTTCFVEVQGAPVEFLQFHRPEQEIWPHAGKTALPYHHVGICSEQPRPDEVHVPHLHIFCTDHESNPFGIQWMRYEADCPLPERVKRISHVAFKVPDLEVAMAGKKVIIQPNRPSSGVRVAFIEEHGAPIEFLEYA